jgi:hypothetical protein
MQDQITCPHCKKSFPVTQAFSHQFEDALERAKKDFEKDREAEREAEREKMREWKKQLEEATAKKEEEAKKKIEEELQMKMKDSQNEREELKEQNKKLQEELLDMGKNIRAIKQQAEMQELENQKKLQAAEDKIREEAKKQAQSEAHFKILEFEKKLADAARANDELKRKLEQGSQQAQGEVLELEIEQKLKESFIYDTIEPVAKGVRGADIVQKVGTQTGGECGSIVWELKRTKAWGGDWISKLKADQRSIGAEIAVIVSLTLPDSVTNVGFVEGVWVCNYDTALGLAQILRANLVDLARAKQNMTNQGDKAAVLYEYLTSTAFSHRIQAIIESYKSLSDDLTTEQRWFEKKWARQEKVIKGIVSNTSGMYGELQGIMGKELAEPDEMKLLAPEDVDDVSLF